MKNEVKHTAHSSYRCEYHITKSEKLNADRLYWVAACRRWIESFEMYDASVDYSTHKVKHGIVPN